MKTALVSCRIEYITANSHQQLSHNKLVLQEHTAMHGKIKNHFRNTTKPGLKATYAVLYKNQTFKHWRHYANKKMREWPFIINGTIAQ